MMLAIIAVLSAAALVVGAGCILRCIWWMVSQEK